MKLSAKKKLPAKFTLPGKKPGAASFPTSGKSKFPDFSKKKPVVSSEDMD